MKYGGCFIMIRNCLACLKEFEINDKESDILRRISCPHCGTHFEVTWLYPFTMDVVEEIPIIPNHPTEKIVNSN
jgi:hypothetical protein